MSIVAQLLSLLTVGGALLLGGCTGDLHDFDRDDGAAGSDGATGAQIYFAPTIQKDLDQLGCSGGGACHGGGAPMHLIPHPADGPSVAANHAQVKPRASSDSQSPLLLKSLHTSGTAHTGSQPFASTADDTYRRWLAWIRAGAPLSPGGSDGGAAISDGGDDAGLDAGASDMGAPADGGPG